MNKGKIRAGLLALAIALAPVACGPTAAVAAVTGGGNGHCHGDKTDPNPEHGNDQCGDDTQVSEVERVILWAAPSTDGVVPGRSPAGLTPSYPQTLVTELPAGSDLALAVNLAPEPGCGRSIAYQVDRYVGTGYALAGLIEGSGGVLYAGGDSTFATEWLVFIKKGSPCATATPTSGTTSPAAPPVTSSGTTSASAPPSTSSSTTTGTSSTSTTAPPSTSGTSGPSTQQPGTTSPEPGFGSRTPPIVTSTAPPPASSTSAGSTGQSLQPSPTDSGDSLPYTGSSWTGPAICLGALLVVAGAVLYGAARSGRAAE